MELIIKINEQDKKRFSKEAYNPRYDGEAIKLLCIKALEDWYNEIWRVNGVNLGEAILFCFSNEANTKEINFCLEKRRYTPAMIEGFLKDPKFRKV